MEIKQINNQTEWDSWLNAQNASFTQSWEWGEILIAEGKIVERLAVIDGGKILAAAQIVFSSALGFKYAFCPKGPVSEKSKIRNPKSETNPNNEIAKYLKTKKCIFFRFEPSVIQGSPRLGGVGLKDGGGFVNVDQPTPTPPKRGFGATIKKTIDVNPRATTILALDKSEDELLEKMHTKTRYNTHLAEKKDLKISHEKNFEVFWSLMQETGQRDGFRLHDKKHYEVIFQSSLSRQLTAFQHDKPVATMIYVSFGNTATYLFGASDYEHRALMAPYLLQSEAIKMAKREGNKFYDFFGIAPRLAVSATEKRSEYRYDEKHQYAGVTRFKLGFGGETVEQPGTFDLIISPFRYRMYELLRRLRRFV
ncbi:MAG: peptidoglycan bridge formation glycyltransferase FemA/FemB family protein [Patescibacteria group bacterium]